MKKLIFIGGAMGTGKTTVSRQLQKALTPSVFLDGDWCWMMEPFTVNDYNKEMVQQNIVFLLRQFLQNPHLETVIFCWVLHQQEIIDSLLEALDDLEFSFYSFSLICSAENLQKRLEGDIKKGLRTSDIIPRSLARLPLYGELDSIPIDADQGVAEEVREMLSHIREEEL